MSQLSMIVESSSYWDLLVVCSDGTVRQNRALLVVIFPFLRNYQEILDTKSDSATLFLPDFTVTEILNAVRTPFSSEQSTLPGSDLQHQDNIPVLSAPSEAGWQYKIILRIVFRNKLFNSERNTLVCGDGGTRGPWVRST